MDLNIKNIIRIEASSNYSKIFFCDNRILVMAKCLKCFEAYDKASCLLRVHHSHLVNKIFIDKLITASKSYIQLANGEQIRISRRKKKLLVNMLQL